MVVQWLVVKGPWFPPQSFFAQGWPGTPSLEPILERYCLNTWTHVVLATIELLYILECNVMYYRCIKTQQIFRDWLRLQVCKLRCFEVCNLGLSILFYIYVYFVSSASASPLDRRLKTPRGWCAAAAFGAFHFVQRWEFCRVDSWDRQHFRTATHPGRALRFYRSPEMSWGAGTDVEVVDGRWW